MGLEVLGICPLNLGFNRARADHLVWQSPPQYTWSWEREQTVICDPCHESKITKTAELRDEKAQETSTTARPQYLFTEDIWFLQLDAEKMMKYWVKFSKRFGWDAAEEEMRFMEWGQKKKTISKATQPKQREEMHKSFLNHVSRTLGDLA